EEEHLHRASDLIDLLEVYKVGRSDRYEGSNLANQLIPTFSAKIRRGESSEYWEWHWREQEDEV
ncbi:hypothetical protein ILYODFUR_022650, partial [Ilyodon furcidens]